MLHKRENHVGVIMQGGKNLHAFQKSMKDRQRFRMIVEKVSSFGHDGFASEKFTGKMWKG